MNNTKNELAALGVGFLVGALLTGFLIANFGYVEEAHRLKDDCEKDLSRGLNCEMRYIKPDQNTLN